VTCGNLQRPGKVEVRKDSLRRYDAVWGNAGYIIPELLGLNSASCTFMDTRRACNAALRAGRQAVRKMQKTEMHRTIKGRIEIGRPAHVALLRSCGENTKHRQRALIYYSNQHLRDPLDPKVNIHYLSYQPALSFLCGVNLQ
jgi:hypothetical protein